MLRSVTTALLLILLCGSTPAAAAAPPYVGRPLDSVLEEFQAGGLDLVYTSAVVSPDLRVTVEPTAGAPRERLVEILDPLGLALAKGPAGSWLVVQKEAGSGVVRGRVVAALGGHRIPSAEVRMLGTSLHTRSGPDGLFKLSGVSPGRPTLEVRAPGFETTTVIVPAVRPTDPVFVVAELPFEASFLTEVHVTPGRHTLAGERAPPNHSITREDLQVAPVSSGDVARAVEFLPGVAAADNSAGFRLRGSSQRDASIVLDGLELYDPFHLNNFQSPYSLVDGNAIDRVDVRAGGFTADRGDRIGGFVEITTTTPVERSGEVEIGSLNSRFTYRTPFAERTGTALVSGRAWYPDAVFDATELGGAEMLKPELQDLYAKATFSLSSRLAWSAHLLLARDNVNFVETGEIVNERADAATDNINAWVRLFGLWNPRVTTETMFSVGTIEKRRVGLAAPDDQPLELFDDRRVQFAGLRQDIDWRPNDRTRILTGAQIRFLQADYDYRLGPAGMPGADRIFEGRPKGNSATAYVAYRRTYSTKFATEFGLRWDRQDYTKDSKFSPRFNAAWRPDERTELRFAIGRYRQSQRIHELAVEDGETTFRPSERSDQVELTFERDLSPHMLFRVDTYFRRLTDPRPRYENLFEPIEIFPETTLDRVVVAPSQAHLRGLEVFLRSPAGKPLIWWASYTFSSATDRIDGRDVPRDWDQEHAAKFLLGYRAGERWSVSLSAVIRSGWPETPVSGQRVPEPGGGLEDVLVIGPRNSERLPGYTRVDARFRRGFKTRRGDRVWLTLDVANVTDRANPCCVADFVFDPGPAGPVDVTKLYDSYLGIRPAFNVLWAF